MRPLAVAAVQALPRRRRLRRVARQPPRNVEMEVLLAPDHAGEGLALHRTRVLAGHALLQGGIERVRLRAAPRKHRIEVGESDSAIVVQAQTQHGAAAGGNFHHTTQRHFGAAVAVADGRHAAVDDVVVDAVFEHLVSVRRAEQPHHIGLVFGHENVDGAVGVQVIRAKVHASGGDAAVVGAVDLRTFAAAPTPGVAEPQLRQQVQLRRFGAAVVRLDPDQQFIGRGLRVFDEHVEVAVLVERAGVHDFVFRAADAAVAVFRQQLRVGKRTLRIFVEHLQVGMGRRGVEVVVHLLDVFAVVSLAVRQAEQAFLENGIVAVPQRQRKAQTLFAVADAGDAVLAPAVGTRPGVIVRQVFPRIAVGAVVLAHGAPLPFAQVRPPVLPGFAANALFEALPFDGGGHRGGGAGGVGSGVRRAVARLLAAHLTPLPEVPAPAAYRYTCFLHAADASARPRRHGRRGRRGRNGRHGLHGRKLRAPRTGWHVIGSLRQTLRRRSCASPARIWRPTARCT